MCVLHVKPRKSYVMSNTHSVSCLNPKSQVLIKPELYYPHIHMSLARMIRNLASVMGCIGFETYTTYVPCHTDKISDYLGLCGHCY